MKHMPVSSSNLHSVGYDATSKVLEIAFRNGRVYQYTNVPEPVYKDLIDTSSHGRYFNYHIKGAYPYRRI